MKFVSLFLTCFAITASALVYRVEAQDTTSGPGGAKQATPGEQLKFQQQRALGNMRELEDRMLKLGEMLRESKPDDSARLLLGVQKAREELILEQMQEITALLGKLSLDEAAAEQEQVLVKLQALKDLLLNADIDLTLKLAQLRKIREAREALQKLVEKEQQQQQQTNRSPEDTKPLAENEKRNQRQGESLAEQIRTKISNGQKASQCVGGACQSMASAAQSLSDKKCDAASQSQQNAVKKLQDADRELQKLEQKLKQEAEAAARQRVTDLLMGMLKQEEKIREATQRVVDVRKDELTPAQAALLERLADSQQETVLLASEAIDICELTEFSYAMPEALRDIREMMGEAATTLSIPDANSELIQSEQDIETELNALLEAMKTASRPSQQTNSQCQGGCCSNKNKLLAEVRMLLRLQKMVGKHTRELRQRELADDIETRELRERSRQLEQRQERLRQISERLKREASPDYVRGEPSGTDT